MRASLLARISAPLLLLFVAPAVMCAQDAPPPAQDTRIWGSIGLGAGGWDRMDEQHSNAGFAYILQATGQRGRNLLTLRLGGTATPFAGGVWDAGVLYGRATRRGNWHLSASGGLGYVRWWDDSFLWHEAEPEESTVGVPISLEASWLATRHLGLGFQAFGNLNTVSSYGALALTLRLGNLRPDADAQLAQRSPLASR